MSEIELGPVSAAQHAASMTSYVHAGCARAAQLGNRGPLRYDTNGHLHPDILAAYRFNLKSGGAEVPSMRLLAGGRYHYFKQELSGPTTIGGSRDWMEPVLGAQLLAPMGKKWLATTRGDVGGFGISDASDITWSAMAGVGWEFAREWLLKLGYRYYYIDYMDGAGASAFGVEGNMHGPWIGVSYGL